MPPFKGEAEEKEPKKSSQRGMCGQKGEEQCNRDFQEVPVAVEFKSGLRDATENYKWRRSLVDDLCLSCFSGVGGGLRTC